MKKAGVSTTEIPHRLITIDPFASCPQEVKKILNKKGFLYD